MAEWEKQSESQDNGSGMVGTVLNGGQNTAAPEQPKFQAFTGQGFSMGEVQSANGGQQMSDEDAALIAQYGDDPELLAAIKASMNE